MALSRAENMARIRSRDTTPEVLLRKALWRRGVRFRINVATPGGKADIAMQSRRVAVFVDGCFWHGCPEHYVRPRTREEFWTAKRRANLDRDRRQTQNLIDDGWIPIRVWEHEVREDVDAAADEVVALMNRQTTKLGWRVAFVSFPVKQTVPKGTARRMWALAET